MATTLLQTSTVNQGQNANVTRFYRLGAGGEVDLRTTENNTQTMFRTAGVLSNLYINVLANTVTAASTLITRKDGANGSMSVTITASTTGKFEDTTNTDTVSAGQEWNYQFTTGATGTSLTFTVMHVLFAANSNTVIRNTHVRDTVSVNSSTRFRSLFAGSWNATEANIQFEFRSSGTLKNLAVDVTTNARTSTTIFGNRINGANGSLSVSVIAGSTGVFEDTINSDSIVNTNLVNIFATTGTGAGESITASVYTDFETTNSTFYEVLSGSTGAISTSTTRYAAISGLGGSSATETDVQNEANLAFSASLLQCFVLNNSITASSTFRLRVNTANGNQSISIPSSTTGWFVDSTNTDNITASDLTNYSIVTGGTGTSLAIAAMSILGTISKNINIPTLLFMGAG